MTSPTLLITDTGALTSILKRDRFMAIGGIVAVASLSWGYLFFDAWRMNHTASCCLALSDPHLRAWPVSALVLMFVMWSIMMVAMMVPSAAPMLLVFAALSRKRREAQRPYVATSLFLLGYLIAWTLFSALVTLIQWRLHAAALLSPRMVSTSPAFAGVILIGAGLFQFTPMKRACLKHCRTPLEFLMTEWREGRLGAIQMGIRHGIACTGCCWLLMALLFVLGVMNLLWVATITLFVLAEKVAPRPQWIRYVGGVACVVWGGWMLVHR